MIKRPHSRRRFFVSGAAVGFATATVRAKARAAQFEFKCASNNASDSPGAKRAQQMWAAVEKESGGRIHTQFFPNSQLGSESAMLTQLRLGALQFFQNVTAMATVVPAMNIANLGFAYRDGDEGVRVMEGPLGDYLRKELAAKGLIGLHSVWSFGLSQVISNAHPVRKPEDLRGFKIRTPDSKILIELFKALGASPTPMSVIETYTALQTKTIDGESQSVGTIESAKRYEVAKYLALTNHAWVGPWMIVNDAAWKSLPPDLQDIVERNNTKYAAIQRQDTAQAEASLIVKLGTQGMISNQIEPGPFHERLGPYYDAWRGQFGPTVWGLLQGSLSHRLT